MLLKYPAAPSEAASETTTAVAVFAPLITILFFKPEFITGVVPVEPMRTTDGEVVLVFVMVRSRLVVPLFDPSIVT